MIYCGLESFATPKWTLKLENRPEEAGKGCKLPSPMGEDTIS